MRYFYPSIQVWHCMETYVTGIRGIHIIFRCFKKLNLSKTFDVLFQMIDISLKRLREKRYFKKHAACRPSHNPLLSIIRYQQVTRRRSDLGWESISQLSGLNTACFDWIANQELRLWKTRHLEKRPSCNILSWLVSGRYIICVCNVTIIPWQTSTDHCYQS